MGSIRRCDVCGNPIDQVVAKIFLAPVKSGNTRSTHSDYTRHADVGECCVKSIANIKWQSRKTNKQRGNSRRLRPAEVRENGDALGAGKSAEKV